MNNNSQEDKLVIPGKIPPGEYLFTTDRPGWLYIWSLNTKGIFIESSQMHERITRQIAVTYDNQYLITCDMKGNLKQWPLQVGKFGEYEDWGDIHDKAIWSIDLTRDNKYQFTSDYIGCVKQWCLKSKKLLKDYGAVHPCMIYSIKSSFDSKFLYTSDGKGSLKKICIEKREVDKTLRENHGTKSIDVIEVSNDNKYLIVAERDGVLEQWCMKKDKILMKCKVNARKILSMKISDDSKVLYVGVNDSKMVYLGRVNKANVEQFRLKGMVRLKTIVQDDSYIDVRLGLSSGDKYLFVTGGSHGMMRQYCAKSGLLVKDYKKIHKGIIMAMAFLDFR